MFDCCDFPELAFRKIIVFLATAKMLFKAPLKLIENQKASKLVTKISEVAKMLKLVCLAVLMAVVAGKQYFNFYF